HWTFGVHRISASGMPGGLDFGGRLHSSRVSRVFHEGHCQGAASASGPGVQSRAGAAGEGLEAGLLFGSKKPIYRGRDAARHARSRDSAVLLFSGLILYGVWPVPAGRGEGVRLDIHDQVVRTGGPKGAFAGDTQQLPPACVRSDGPSTTKTDGQ